MDPVTSNAKMRLLLPWTQKTVLDAIFVFGGFTGVGYDGLDDGDWFCPNCSDQ